jgi:hypothetical protein
VGRNKVGRLRTAMQKVARRSSTYVLDRYGRGDTTAQNKGMKQTSVEHIGRSQLIPGVRRLFAESGVRS